MYYGWSCRGIFRIVASAWNYLRSVHALLWQSCKSTPSIADLSQIIFQQQYQAILPRRYVEGTLGTSIPRRFVQLYISFNHGIGLGGLNKVSFYDWSYSYFYIVVYLTPMGDSQRIHLMVLCSWVRSTGCEHHKCHSIMYWWGILPMMRHPTEVSGWGISYIFGILWRDQSFAGSFRYPLLLLFLSFHYPPVMSLLSLGHVFYLHTVLFIYPIKVPRALVL